MQSHLVFTVSEATKLLKIPKNKIYILLELGRLEGIKIGSDWRIKRSSIEKLLNKK